jgi:hypothetical protein
MQLYCIVFRNYYCASVTIKVPDVHNHRGWRSLVQVSELHSLARTPNDSQRMDTQARMTQHRSHTDCVSDRAPSSVIAVEWRGVSH